MAEKRGSDDTLLKNQFLEMSERSERQSRWVYSDFLSPSEQSLLLSMGNQVQPVTLLGGWDGAERRIACFGSEDRCFEPPQPPFCCILAEPKQKKFAGRMGHRDVLGALMGLGVKRKTLGDLLIRESCAWILCLDSISDYLLQQLHEIGSTTVVCRRDELPAFTQQEPEPVSLAAASDRVDALLAAVYRLSRSQAAEAIRQGLVFVDSRLCEAPSFKVRPGALVNLRGRGRFRYHGPAGETHSGRLRASVGIYP